MCYECKFEQYSHFAKKSETEKTFLLGPISDVLVCIAIDFDVADIPGRIWKWPSLGK